MLHTSPLQKYCSEDFDQVFPLLSFPLQDTTKLLALLEKLGRSVYTGHAGVQLQQMGPISYPTYG